MSIRIGLVGTGTVGGGCIDIINAHRESYRAHYGIDIELVRVCSRVRAEAEAHGVGDLFCTDFNEIINDPDIDLVIELIGGTGAAREVVCGALRAGKAVVTANKALMATCGEEVMQLAEENGVELAFEASVGGGIPIIDPLKHSLFANRIDSVMGIVNGTTNYMLTRMAEYGMSYDAALAEAQLKGFAEADPTADVDGLDAAAKIAILASIAFNSRVTLSQVPAEGIRNIQPADLATADEMGYCVKLLAIAKRTDAGIDVRVHPTMLPKHHPLATVNGVDNAIYVEGDAVGQTMFFGPGAGSGPAASAVMGDVLEVSRHLQAGVAPLVGCTCTDHLPMVPMEDLVTKYYIHFVVKDRSGVLAATAQVFAKHQVSVYSVVQRGAHEDGTVDLAYVTHSASESGVRACIEEIKTLPAVLVGDTEPVVIRVEE